MDEMLDLRRPLTMDEVTMLLGQRDVAIYQLTKQASALRIQIAEKDAELQRLRATPQKRKV